MNNNASFQTQITTTLQTLRRELRLLWKNPIDYLFICMDPPCGQVQLLPFDPNSAIQGNKMIATIKRAIPAANVLFVGSASLGLPAIANDIDILIPTEKDSKRQEFAKQLTSLLGKPKITNARFIKWKLRIQIYPVGIILGDQRGRMIQNLLRAYITLKENKDALAAYKQLKINSHGAPIRQYHKNRLDFFNTSIPKHINTAYTLAWLKNEKLK